MLQIYDSDFKSAMINVFQWAITNTLEINANIEIPNKEIRDMGMKQIEIL